jgi:hypothetical protein
MTRLQDTICTAQMWGGVVRCMLDGCKLYPRKTLSVHTTSNMRHAPAACRLDLQAVLSSVKRTTGPKFTGSNVCAAYDIMSDLFSTALRCCTWQKTALELWSIAARAMIGGCLLGTRGACDAMGLPNGRLFTVQFVVVQREAGPTKGSEN